MEAKQQTNEEPSIRRNDTQLPCGYQAAPALAVLSIMKGPLTIIQRRAMWQSSAVIAAPSHDAEKRRRYMGELHRTRDLSMTSEVYRKLQAEFPPGLKEFKFQSTIDEC